MRSSFRKEANRLARKRRRFVEDKAKKFSDEEAEQGAVMGGSDRILKSKQKNWQDFIWRRGR